MEPSAALSRQAGPDRPDLLRQEVLADIFETTAARCPEHTALLWQGQALRYAELNQRADRVAHHLLAAGVQAGDVLGLYLQRGIDLLTLQLGIAKTGAAWLALDADTPAERIHTCLQDANARALLSHHAQRDKLQGDSAPLPCPTWWAEDLLAPPQPPTTPLLRRNGNPSTTVRGHHPAYLIYTSGSTGKPKGIAISQASICHFLRSENSQLGVRADDTVYQGFSVAFDMSFEEIWISYLVGATLWIAPKDIATDAQRLPQALRDNGISVLHAVPTLLSLFQDDVPNLRLINLGGEMCPPALVERWAQPGRQIFNTYGPTEATVSASLALLQAGQAVTIGQALPNYELLVIRHPMPENGVPTLLPQGEVGELCISGPGLAIGYVGRPELTAEKFALNPFATGEHNQRLYRTGDLARLVEHGQVHCLGRTDDQVKIRGFRVELGEIEAVLAAQAGVGAAAVQLRRDKDIELLVAFVALDGQATAQTAQLTPAWRRALATQLPSYMVPSHYEVLDVLPRLTSGKIDRNALKQLPLRPATPEDDNANDAPHSATEAALFGVLHSLFPGQSLRRTADFFDDLGGHSLLAARVASALRAQPGLGHVAVRHIYQHRTLGAIAAAIEASAPPYAPDATAPAGQTGNGTSSAPEGAAAWQPTRALVWRRVACGGGQLLVLPLLICLRMAQWLAPFFTYHMYTGDPGDSTPRAIGLAVAAFLASTLLEFGVAIAAKWLLLGRLRTGRYPLWGWLYFRWWLADRLIESAPAYLFSGSSLYALWLRLLGAHIGRDVLIGSAVVRAPDLLHAADGVSLGNAVSLENVRVHHGEFIVGPIVLERDAYVGSYAVLQENTRLGESAHLQGQSCLLSGQRIPDQRVWQGSPAQDCGAFDLAQAPARPDCSPVRRALEGAYYLLGALLMATLFFIPVFPTFVLIDWLDEYELPLGWLGDGVSYQLVKYFVLSFPAAAVLIVCTALLSAAIRWLVLPRLRPGCWSVHSSVYLRKWLVNQIQENSLNVLHGIYATLYSPWWYRLLGAKVGREAEISSALGLVPDMLTLGDETFIADAVMLGDEEIDRGWMRMQPTVIGQRSFVGNGAYIPDGTTLPDNVLVGVLSTAPANTQMRSGQTWLGSPPMHLPAREQTQGYPAHLTFAPLLWRRLARGAIEAFRIVAPHAIVISVGYTMVLDILPIAADGDWLTTLSYLAACGLLYGCGALIFVAALKWMLIGRYRPRNAPMWTLFVWISEAITSLYEGFAIPNFMRYLRGTPWLPWAMRILGVRIGKHVYMDTTDITEFDCVQIGDFSELNGQCCPQTHLFEDRVMKVDHVQLGSFTTLDARSIVLYGAHVQEGAHVGPLTLVMKGESLPANTRWQGCPATIA
ncbi:amino acid adenylation domain-containing protein [Curvibacter sp. CHRR-16]|uniref:Pls/PosA family non-ribosomal peptide synthetase n=1 Tax=Curvibacter sp. CHRR-16 TaxID=2835872 RepID=UPI001BDA3FD0|nr:Pls/PosA family non-ribosomal peptide synthetase [Curvibacter sp. CHRR-16]MBT0571645.1 amino acid adenylation domain-containing protein [Curvibacter sp. CHRR-16]